MWLILIIIIVVIIVFIKTFIKMDLAETEKWKNKSTNIMAVDIVDEKHWLKETYQQSGFSIGAKGSPRVYYRRKQAPHHIEYTFEVTYLDETVEITKAIEGTEKFFILMRYVGKPKIKRASSSSNVQSNELQNITETPKTGEIENNIVYTGRKKNNICAGEYIFDDDIPCGKYDLIALSGSGSISTYISKEQKLSLYQHFGVEKKYEAKEYRNLAFSKNDKLIVSGTVIIEIVKSQKIIIA